MLAGGNETGERTTTNHKSFLVQLSADCASLKKQLDNIEEFLCGRTATSRCESETRKVLKV